MLNDHMIKFLEAVVVFLLLTNAVSAAVAACALRVLNRSTVAAREPTNLKRMARAILGSAT